MLNILLLAIVVSSSFVIGVILYILTREEIERNYPDAVIESGAVIESDAVIESGARIGSIKSKFIGNISPTKEGMNIRIGCEIHSIEDWTKRGAAIARRADESEWWNKTGKAMLTFLKNEANVYMLNSDIEL